MEKDKHRKIPACQMLWNNCITVALCYGLCYEYLRKKGTFDDTRTDYNTFEKLNEKSRNSEIHFPQQIDSIWHGWKIFIYMFFRRRINL